MKQLSELDSWQYRKYTTVCENCNTKKKTCDRNDMAINKRLELQSCTWSVSMWFQYGVKPPCTAIKVSMHRGMESKRPWISSWGMSIHAVCMWAQSVKSRCCRILTIKSPTNHIPDMFDGRHIWRTCRPGKQWYPSSLEEACTILATWPGIVLLKYGTWSCLNEGQYLGL